MHLDTIKQLRKKIDIYGDPERILEVLTSERYITSWCNELHHGATIESDWAPGSKIYFVDQTRTGVVGRIANRNDKCIEINYEGLIENGAEDYKSDIARALIGKGEKYLIERHNGRSALTIVTDVNENQSEKMSAAWDAALKCIKSLIEH